MAQASDPRTIGSRIETLLDELGTIAEPVVRDRAEEIARLLVSLYGAALERIVAELEAAGEPGRAVLGRLARDELMSSLLILHGLHPVDVETRVRQALERVRPYLGSHAGGVELLGVGADGVVRLRLEGSCSGCPSSSVTVRLAIERAVLEAAPEVIRVEAEGVVAERPSPLLQIQPRPDSAQPEPRQPGRTAAPAEDDGDGWTDLGTLPDLPVGGLTTIEVRGARLLLCRLGGTGTGWYAYRDGCPGCGAGLGAAVLVGDVLTCPGCTARYDVRLAGRVLDTGTVADVSVAAGGAGAGGQLAPVPLLTERGSARVALPLAVAGRR